MSAAARLGAFAVALALVFGAAFAVGGVVDPIGQDQSSADSSEPVQDLHGDDQGGHP